MRSRSMLFISNLLGFMVMLFSLWWIAENIAVLPDYKLIVALAAVTGLVANHFRWWSWGKKVNGNEALEKMSYLVVCNYLVMLLGFVLVDF